MLISIKESGFLNAVNEKIIKNEIGIGVVKIIEIVPNGSVIKEGDLLVELDRDRLEEAKRTALKRFGDLVVSNSGSSSSRERVDYHQVILHMAHKDDVISAHSKLVRLMQYGHEEQDYQIKVPLTLLKEAEKTRKMFNMVLGSIAGISLLVGGIGIMNIMLASVSERTKEIGLRRAIGAKERDVVIQFLTESILLSLLGGVIGVLLGVFLPHLISSMFDIETVLSASSVILSFTISGLVGVVFGSYPAFKSAKLSPIVALRD